MKKTGKWILGILAFLLVLVIVLAYLPQHSGKTHPNMAPEEVAARRAELAAQHLQFTTSDGVSLFVRQWRPDSLESGKDQTAILIFHGVTAYSGPYDMAGKPFSARGYATFGLDYRGHGLSDGTRGDYPSRERWTEDLSEGVRFIKGLGYEKVIVMGHSLGVAAAIYCAQRIPNEIDGLILLSGGYKGREGVREEPSLFQKVQILCSSIIRPSYPAIAYYREGMTGTDDPLFNFSYTLRFARMVKMDELKLPASLNIPVLVAVGDEDELFEIQAVREVYDDVPGDHKAFMVLEGARHARFPAESWQQLADWVDKSFD